MDFYLTNLASGDRLRFPIAPDRLNVKTGASTIGFQIIKTGEVKIPRGSTLAGYSWNGTFPGQRMANYSFVFDWQEPSRIVSLLKEWESNGDTLRLMVTELSINEDVYIESFTYEYYGIGDCSYTLNLSKRISLTIETIAAPVIPEQPAEESTETKKDTTIGTVKTNASRLNVRQKASTSSKILGKLNNGSTVEILGKSGNWYIIPYDTGIDGKGYVYSSYVKITSTGTSSSTSSGGNGSGSSGGNGSGSSGGGSGSSSSGSSSGSSTSGSGGNYTAKTGDSLMSIAKTLLGDSSRYMEIYELNKAAIDAANSGKTCSKYTIYAGLSLKLPATTTAKKATSSTSTLSKKTVSTVTKAATTAAKVSSSIASTVSKLVTTKPSGTVTSVKTVAAKVSTAVANVVSNISSLLKK